jgi:hypothetical protein
MLQCVRIITVKYVTVLNFLVGSSIFIYSNALNLEGSTGSRSVLKTVRILT